MKNTATSDYNLLNCSAELKEAIAITAGILQPEKIFLMEQEKDTNQRHLVIIIPENECRSLTDIQQLQELSHLKQQNITCRIMNSNAYEAQFRISPIYLTVTCNEKTLAYDDGYFEILEGIETNLYADKKKAMECFYNGIERVNELIAGAKVYSESNLDKAAFHLHTAVETCLDTLLESITGEITITHQLNELLDLTACCNSSLHHSLNNGSATDERLLKILKEANSNNSNNTIFTVADIYELITRIAHLQETAESTFTEWLGRYEFHFLNRDINE